jgi:mevalonate kinase
MLGGSLESSIQASAPGKIILCGEHAVLAGTQALVLSTAQYTTATLRSTDSEEIELCFSQQQWSYRCPLKEIAPKAQAINERWKLSIQNKNLFSLEHPCEWIVSLLAYFRWEEISGLHLELTSQLPLGSGMGSSAAAISASLCALSKYVARMQTTSAIRPLKATDQSYYSPMQAWGIARQLECLCHGQSSGIDLVASLFGGCHSFQQEKFNSLKISSLKNFYWFYSGKPVSSTKECVQWSQKQLINHPEWLDQISLIAANYKKALIANHFNDLIEATRASHRWLKQLSVVPEFLNSIIDLIEKLGGAAKVSGAGSLEGQAAGVILVVADSKIIEYLRSSMGIDLLPLRLSDQGAWSQVPHEQST